MPPEVVEAVLGPRQGLFPGEVPRRHRVVEDETCAGDEVPAVGVEHAAVVAEVLKEAACRVMRDRIGAAPDDSGVPYGFERVLARLAAEAEGDFGSAPKAAATP